MSYLFPPDTDPSTYAWIITKDHLAEGNSGDPYTDFDSEVGVVGPSNATPEQIKSLRAGKGRAFKMYDDDGELYYSGRIVMYEDDGSLAAEVTDDGFGPLDDFGAPNAGATEIRYWIDGKLQTL